jgi:hypothetical protein
MKNAQAVKWKMRLADRGGQTLIKKGADDFPRRIL